MRFETKMIGDKPDVIALDGSEVRVLCGLSRGGLAVFSLAPHAVSMPPWPGAGEAYPVDGIWRPTRASEGISQQTVRPGV